MALIYSNFNHRFNDFKETSASNSLSPHQDLQPFVDTNFKMTEVSMRKRSIILQFMIRQIIRIPLMSHFVTDINSERMTCSSSSNQYHRIMKQWRTYYQLNFTELWLSSSSLLLSFILYRLIYLYLFIVQGWMKIITVWK